MLTILPTVCVAPGPRTARTMASSDPFRAPHHSVGSAGLVAELILAGDGVLFLDESHSFKRESIAALCSAIRDAILDEESASTGLPRLIVLDMNHFMNTQIETDLAKDRTNAIAADLVRAGCMLDILP